MADLDTGHGAGGFDDPGGDRHAFHLRIVP
jgi:hypothetical protein